MRIFKRLPFGGTVMGMSRDEIKHSRKRELESEFERMFNRGGLKIND